MDAINQKMQESKLDWKSNAFILDDVDAKSIAKVAIEMLYLSIVWVCTISLKSMFQSSNFLCCILDIIHSIT
jgi:hypothetical protein